MSQMAGSVWKTKSFTVGSACTNALQVKTILDAEIPTPYTTAMIACDNQDWSDYLNNQMVFTIATGGSLYVWYRYKQTDGTILSGSSWGTGTGLVLTQGVKYTIFYQ